jgi:hypothetical protein
MRVSESRKEGYSDITQLDQCRTSQHKLHVPLQQSTVCDGAAGGEDRPEDDEPLGRVSKSRVKSENFGLLHIAKQPCFHQVHLALSPGVAACAFLPHRLSHHVFALMIHDKRFQARYH